MANGAMRITRFRILIILILLVTFTASSEPLVTKAQSGTTTIESNDPQVTQEGTWTVQSTPQASGDSYLYSSGSSDDVLTFEFEGSAIEIIYVGHPSFGSFAIDIDNNIRRTVVATDEGTTFDNRAVVDYLDDGPHTLRVYSVDGPIAIDAFITDITPPPDRSERAEVGVTYYVSPTGSNTNTCLSAGTACLTIQAAINKAGTDDIISVAPGTYTSAININENVTIAGSDQSTTIIDSTSFTGNVVTIESGTTATLSNVTITNITDGRAIFNNGTLTLNDSTITNNTGSTTSSYGIAITNRPDAVITINRSSITNNVVSTPVSIDGNTMIAGTIYNDFDGTITISESLISNNSTTNNGRGLLLGGAMALSSNVTIIDSVISNNVAHSGGDMGEAQGGAMFIDGTNTNVSIIRTTISGNVASGLSASNHKGGAMAVLSSYGGDVVVTIVDSIIDGNHADKIGGGIYTYDSGLYIENTSIINNTAETGGGFAGGSMTIANSTISGNSATDSGGAIYTEGVVYISNTTIANNTADSDNNVIGTGGGIHSLGTVNLKNSILAGNRRGISINNDCSGSITLQGYNLFGQNGSANGCPTSGTNIVLSGDINTIIDPLYYNGGHTPTHALNVGTTPVDAIPAASCTYTSAANNPLFSNGNPITHDQRGSTRPVNANCDIGAYEIEADQCTLDDSIIRISLGELGLQYNDHSFLAYGIATMSNDGRYSLFQTDSGNLSANDTNLAIDIFRYDHQTGELLRITEDSTGTQFGLGGAVPSMSDDGRFITFLSEDPNFVTGDTNLADDIFIFDAQTGTFERLSISSASAEANGSSIYSIISGDGQHVVFFSQADNLVPNDTNGLSDYFVRDRQGGTTSRVSVDSSGNQASGDALVSAPASISFDGRFVAFSSFASDLVSLDTNGLADIFVHDRQTGETTLISKALSGDSGNNISISPDISSNGRYVAFISDATDLINDGGGGGIFVYDRQLDQLHRVDVSSSGQPANSGGNTYLSMSDDGRFVAFSSSATNLVSNDTNGIRDVFVHDRLTGQTIRLTDDLRSQQPNGDSTEVAISRDGKYVTWRSSATNLVCGDTNTKDDVFLAAVPLAQFIPAPTNLTATPNDSTQIDLTWTDNSSDESNFRIERSPDGSTGWTEIDTAAADATTYSDTGLTASTAYHYRVRAYRAAGGGHAEAFSNYTNVDTEKTAPSAPSGLSVTPVSGEMNLELSWTDNASDETNFRIERSPNGSADWVEIDTAAADATTYSGTGLDPSTEYFYRVRAYRAADSTYVEAFSNYSNVDSSTTVSAAPSNLSADALPYNGNDIQLDWTDNSSDETDFEIERSPANTASWAVITTVASNTTTYTDTDASLVCEMTYDYRVRAYRSSDNTNSMYSNTVQVTDYCAPEEPFDLTVTNTGETSITIGWTDIATSETAYFVERSRDNSNWSQIASLGADVETYQDTTVGCETQYYYRVRPYRSDIDIYSPVYSNTANTTTTTCVTPGLMKLNSPFGTIATEKPTFNWNESAQTSWYNLRVQKNGVTAFTQWYDAANICNAGTCTVTITSALTVGNYTWSVQGYGSTYGVGPWNPSLDFTIVAPIQSSPVNTTYDLATPPTFTWNKVNGLTWYYLYLSGPSGYLHTQWYDSSNCPSSVCSITLANTLPSAGSYTWYLRGWGPNGYSPWSGAATFTNAPPAPPPPTGLTVVLGAAGNPLSFEWNEDTNVLWYNVIITKSTTTVLNQWYQKGTATITCAAGTCSVSPSLTYTNGSYAWRVQAYAAGGITSSTPLNFTVTLLAPDKPDNLLETMTNGVPTAYSWDEDAKASWFNLYIAGPSGVILNQWYQVGNSAMVCESGTCTVSPTLTYVNGNYTWYVQAHGAGGAMWSDGKPLTVNIPPPNAPTNLQAPLTNGVPTAYSWDDVANASWFNFYLSGPSGVILNQWYQRGSSTIVCESGTCTVTPAVSYSNGQYGWKVQAYGTGGLGPFSSTSTVIINEEAPSVPSGMDETFTDGLPTTYQWNDDANADSFSIYISGPSGVLLYKTYAKSDSNLTCNTTTCTLSPSLSYVNGNYVWYLQAISPGGSQWSTGVSFSIVVDPPNVPTNLDVAFTDVYPTTFSWNDDVKATRFTVYIAGPAGVAHNVVYQKGNIALTCDSGTCSVSPTLSVTNGNYVLYIQAIGAGGNNWSAAFNFSVTIPAPSAPTQLAPADGAVVTSATIEFQWTEVNYATWYQVQFQNSSGTVLSSVWFSSSICAASTCTTNITLPSGVSKWRVQGYGLAGFGTWSTLRNLTRLQ